MSELRVVGDDDAGPRCAVCGGVAAGPCASCRAFVCGDCSVLTEGGLDTWAICVRCERKKGRSLEGGWRLVLVWLGSILLVLLAFAGLAIAFGR